MDTVTNRQAKSLLPAADMSSMMMKRICAWCQADLDPSIPDTVKTTHGICVPCAEKLILKEQMRLQSLLDRMGQFKK